MGELQAWLLRQLQERNWSAREASLAAGLNHGAVSHYLAGHRPSAENCRKIAVAFGVPASVVLILAGYMARPAGHDPFLAQVTELTSGWTGDQKERLLRLVRELDRSAEKR